MKLFHLLYFIKIKRNAPLLLLHWVRVSEYGIAWLWRSDTPLMAINAQINSLDIAPRTDYLASGGKDGLIIIRSLSGNSELGQKDV